MTWYEKGGVALFALVALLMFKGCHDQNVAHAARDSLREQQATLQIGVLKRANDSLAKVVKHDTTELTKVVTRWKSLRDTLVQSDTVTLTQRESVLVLRTDTVVMQCAKTINACLALNNTKDSLISQLNIRWDHRPKPPGFLKRTTHDLLLFGAGVGVGKVIR